MSFNDSFNSASANYSDYLNGGEFDFDGFPPDHNVNPNSYDAQHFNSSSEQFVYDPSYEPDFSEFDTPSLGYPAFASDHSSPSFTDPGSSVSSITTPSMSFSSMTSAFQQSSPSSISDFSECQTPICEAGNDTASGGFGALGEDVDLFGEDADERSPAKTHVQTSKPSFTISPGGLTLPSFPMAVGNKSASQSRSPPLSVANSHVTSPATPQKPSVQRNVGSSAEIISMNHGQLHSGAASHSVNPASQLSFADGPGPNGTWNSNYHHQYTSAGFASESDLRFSDGQDLDAMEHNIINMQERQITVNRDHGSFSGNNVSSGYQQIGFSPFTSQPQVNAGLNSASHGMHTSFQIAQCNSVNGAASTYGYDGSTPATPLTSVTTPQQASVPRYNLPAPATQPLQQNPNANSNVPQQQTEYIYGGLGQPVLKVPVGTPRNLFASGPSSSRQQFQNALGIQHDRSSVQGNVLSQGPTGNMSLRQTPPAQNLQQSGHRVPFNPAQTFARSSAMNPRNTSQSNVHGPLQTPSMHRRTGSAPSQISSMNQSSRSSSNMPQIQGVSMHNVLPPVSNTSLRAQPTASSSRQPRAPSTSKKNNKSDETMNSTADAVEEDFEFVPMALPTSCATKPVPTRKRARAESEVEDAQPAKRPAAGLKFSPAAETPDNTPSAEVAKNLNPFMLGFIQGVRKAQQVDLAKKQALKSEAGVTLDNIIWEYCHEDMPIEPILKLPHSRSMYNSGETFCEVVQTYAGGGFECQLSVMGANTWLEEKWELADRYLSALVRDGHDEWAEETVEGMIKYNWSVGRDASGMRIVFHRAQDAK